MNENTTIHNGAPDRFVMLSGGMDSVAMAHYCIENKWDGPPYSAWQKRPVAIHLDTTVGLPAQRIYVELLADHYGWQLWTLRTHQEYEEHTEEQGFYGNQQHSKIFNVLKGRQMSKLATVSGNPHFYFGTRRAESAKRANIERVRFDDGKGATVHNPIADWSDEDVVDYLRSNDVPFNPLWEAAHFTDCGCGSTADRLELEVELEAEGFDVMAEKLRNLEKRIETGDRRETWAWGSFSASERSRLDAEADPEQVQLSDLMCGPNCSGRSKALRGGDSP